ncbi:hypothetical protein [Microcoleus sp. AT3-A2]|uniref:hypothetical protein n=1 Tax=Microcoleus sp. AT3-A2 TaxID=2818610 RepID=UPI002FD0170D
MSISLENILNLSGGTYTLTVSETNTTKFAYGGQLRLYDVHIAKMFEVTYSDSQEIPNPGGRTWYCRAGNGKIDMGNSESTVSLLAILLILMVEGNQSVVRSNILRGRLGGQYPGLVLFQF